MSNPSNPDEILTIPEVAEETKFSVRTVVRRIEDGSLPAFKLGGRWRIRRRELDAALDGMRIATRAEVLK